MVISIIATLVSMLLPALRGAKETAARAQCMGNVRQQVVAFLAYADDAGGFMPLLLGEGPEPGKLNERDLLIGDYTGGQWRSWLCPQFHAQTQTAARDGGGYGGTVCGSSRDSWEWPGEVWYLAHPNAGSLGWFGWPNNPYGYTSVAISTGVKVTANGAASYLVSPGHSLHRVRDPSATNCRVELYPDWNNAGGFGWPGWNNGRVFDSLGGNLRHARNNGTPAGGHIGWWDGHATWSTRMGPHLPWNGFQFTAP